MATEISKVFEDIEVWKNRQWFESKYIPQVLLKGKLSEEVIRKISEIKNEPEWMLGTRLKAMEAFNKIPLPDWGPDLTEINFDEISYYTSPVLYPKPSTWEALPESFKEVYRKLGLSREYVEEYLGGALFQHDSAPIFREVNKYLEEKGVIFLSLDEAVREYPEIVKKHFGKAVSMWENKFAALNTAVWSGGVFIYVPENTKVEIPLHAYFRINMDKTGQFERTLIVCEKNSEVTYVEGCFTKGTLISTNPDFKPIEEIKPGDKVLTHKGEYKQVYFTQVREYSGNLYKIKVYGSPNEELEVTEEHPFLCVRRTRKDERNKKWKLEWVRAKDLREGDYLVTPINKIVENKDSYEIEITVNKKRIKRKVPLTKEFFRLVGYYLAEGSISKKSYLRFSFGLHEEHLVEDVKQLLRKCFGVNKFYEFVHKKYKGVDVVVASSELCRIFEIFGTSSESKKIPHWMMLENPEKQKELIIGLFRGDGNYYKKRVKNGWLKEIFRINTTSFILAKQVREILLRLGIASFINVRDRRKEKRKIMYTIGIGGEFLKPFGDLVGIKVEEKINGKKRASMFYVDKDYIYAPIRKISKRFVNNIKVYNFGVLEDESYVANGFAVHNCTAPIYSLGSLHAAVVEAFVGKNAKLTYVTLQNWSKNVYNLVTKRAIGEEDSQINWISLEMGSKKTMLYPSLILKDRAKGKIYTVSIPSDGQIIDSGGRLFMLGKDSKAEIVSKGISIGLREFSKAVNRTDVRIFEGAKNANVKSSCEALIIGKGFSESIPRFIIEEKDAHYNHEAKMDIIDKERLLYLKSKGINEKDAIKMLVFGFLADIEKEVPSFFMLEIRKLLDIELEEYGGFG